MDPNISVKYNPIYNHPRLSKSATKPAKRFVYTNTSITESDHDTSTLLSTEAAIVKGMETVAKTLGEIADE